MNLHHSVARYAADVVLCVKAVVVTGHVNVVHVEQQSASSLARQLCQKGPLGESRFLELQIARRVLQHQWSFEKILYLPDALAHVTQTFPGEWKRQQVVRVDAGYARPAQVVRNPRRVNKLRARLQLFHVLPIESETPCITIGRMDARCWSTLRA